MSPMKLLILLRMRSYKEPFDGYTQAHTYSDAMRKAFEDFHREGLIHDYVSINYLVAAGQRPDNPVVPYLSKKGEDFVEALCSLKPAPVPVNDAQPELPRYLGMVRHYKYGEYYLWQSHDGLYGVNRDKNTPPHCGYPSLEALMAAKGL